MFFLSSPKFLSSIWTCKISPFVDLTVFRIRFGIIFVPIITLFQFQAPWFIASNSIPMAHFCSTFHIPCSVLVKKCFANLWINEKWCNNLRSKRQSKSSGCYHQCEWFCVDAYVTFECLTQKKIVFHLADHW